jgi:hypothetical protein
MYIDPFKKGPEMGFYEGSSLPDTNGILAGKGNLHKYVELKETTIDTALVALWHAAFEARKLC